MGRRVRCPCGTTFEIEAEQAETVCPSCGRKGKPKVETVPRRDVFISYSSHDQKIADAACAILEQNKLRCWIAPRDILPGADWGGAIVQGIEGCRLFVLVYSSNSNQSQQVLREVERAVANGLPIIPLRLDTTAPTKSMEYFISSQHWMDAMNPPLEAHLSKLAETAKRLLVGKTDTAPVPLVGQTQHSRARSAPWMWIAAALVVVGGSLAADQWLRGRPPESEVVQKELPKGPRRNDKEAPPESRHDPIYESIMRQRFTSSDGDRSGELSITEMKRMPGLPDGENLVRMFERMDADKNAAVSPEEWLGMAEGILRLSDDDGDGKMNRPEFVSQPRFQGRDRKGLLELFRSKDLDNDGYLSIRENERAQADNMMRDRK